MKIAIYTLGCKTNQYETQYLENELASRGHTLGGFDERCDAYVINTCSVTAVADKKSRQAVRRARQENPDAVVAVCGCYSQTNPDAARELGADVVAGTGGRGELIGLVERAFSEKTRLETLDDPLKRRSFEFLPAGGLNERTRAYLKIEDGCVNFCSYCIIPYARGPVRSLPLETAAAEARRLQDEDFREIVLTGIEISSWGADFKTGETLSDLIAALCAAAPKARLRLGSLEPRTVTEEFCLRLKNEKNLCAHFHLSLQSGCDATLLRMKRKYDTARFFESVTLLREHFPECAITTDLITGFPGETEGEFAETLAFIEKCAFSAMHIFPYSRRPGTPAASMPEQVKNAVKAERAAAAAGLAARMEREFLSSRVGKTLNVLFETEENGFSEGHAANYARVRAEGAGLRNTVKCVNIIELKDNILYGVVVG